MSERVAVSLNGRVYRDTRTPSAPTTQALCGSAPVTTISAGFYERMTGARWEDLPPLPRVDTRRRSGRNRNRWVQFMRRSGLNARQAAPLYREQKEQLAEQQQQQEVRGGSWAPKSREHPAAAQTVDNFVKRWMYRNPRLGHESPEQYERRLRQALDHERRYHDNWTPERLERATRAAAERER